MQIIKKNETAQNGLSVLTRQHYERENVLKYNTINENFFLFNKNNQLPPGYHNNSCHHNHTPERLKK